jgi:putative transcriptional regulator
MVQHLKNPILLASAPQVRDPAFSETVILVVEYNKQGALGFIINQPKAVPLREVIQLGERKIAKFIPTWLGGPVGLDGGVVLADQSIAALPSSVVTFKHPDIALSSHDSAVTKLVDHAEWMHEVVTSSKDSGQPVQVESLYPFRFLVGYAGWGPNQLDTEIRNGHWLEVPLEPRILFNTPWNQIWTHSISAVVGTNIAKFSPQPQSLLH